jgi:hypothetical protein
MRDHFRCTIARVSALASFFIGCGAASGPLDPPPSTPAAAPETLAPASASAVIGSSPPSTLGGSPADPVVPDAPTPVTPDPAASVPPDLPVIDEPIYAPGGRARPKGSAVEASLDDEIIAKWNRGGLSEADKGPKGKPPHAAPRVKVDVIEVRGGASEADMQRAARLKSYWPFRICYEEGLRRTQKLHGTIKLRLTIGSNGRPSGVQQLSTELGDAAVVSCVVKSAMGLGLPPPSSGAPQVTLDISLWPGDEPVSVKTALRGKSAVLPEAPAIADALRAHLGEVRLCYAEGRRRHEGLWGRLGLALRMNAGAIDDVTEIESHFPDGEVTECVRKIFLHAAVPPADHEIVVVYPLRLGHLPEPHDTRR